MLKNEVIKNKAYQNFKERSFAVDLKKSKKEIEKLKERISSFINKEYKLIGFPVVSVEPYPKNEFGLGKSLLRSKR